MLYQNSLSSRKYVNGGSSHKPQAMLLLRKNTMFYVNLRTDTDKIERASLFTI